MQHFGMSFETSLHKKKLISQRKGLPFADTETQRKGPNKQVSSGNVRYENEGGLSVYVQQLQVLGMRPYQRKS